MRLILLGIALSLGSARANPDWTNLVEAPSLPGQSTTTTIQNSGGGQFYVGGTTTASDFLLVRADASGKERWRVTYNGTNKGADTLRTLAVDTAGNAYAVGRSAGAGGLAEIAVLKCTAKGVQKWAARFRDADNRPLDPTASAVDPAGNLYVVATRPAGEGLVDQLLLRFSTRGQLQWLQTNAQQLASSDARVALVTDGTKAAYLVGMSGSLVTLTRYLPTGAREWRLTHPGELPTNSLAAAAVDSAGNLHVVSSYRLTTDRVDAQLAKVTRKASVLWRAWHRGLITATMLPSGLTLDKSGNVTVYGLERRGSNLNNDLFVASWDRLGRQRWHSWQDVGDWTDIQVTATARPQGGVGVMVNNRGYGRLIALALDGAGNRRWQETNEASVELGGLVAPAADAMVAAVELTEGQESLRGILLLGYTISKDNGVRLTRLPKEQTIAEGAPAAIGVTARGSGALSYRWWRDGGSVDHLIVDAEKPNLLIPAFNSQFMGEYAVEVISGETSVLSPSARMNVLQAPQFISHPSRRDSRAGLPIWFDAVVDGSEPLHLQWQLNGFDIPGAHDPILVIPSLSISNVGNYRLLASNAMGVALSEPLTYEFARTGRLDTWSWIEPYPQGNAISGIAFGAGRFVATTWGGTLMSSTDATAWDIAPPFPNEIFEAITWADGRFVVVGGDNQGNAIVRTSTNGFEWSIRAIPSSNALFRVTGGGGIILTVTTSGEFFRSTNGTDWLQLYPGFYPSALGYGNGLFVAAGSLPLVHTSPDGIHWTPHNLPAPMIAPAEIAFGNGRFVLVGTSGVGLAVSSDGQDWTMLPYGDEFMTGITYARNEFVTVSSQGNSYASVDGLRWFQQSIGPAAIHDVAYGNGVFACAGSGGAIYTSPNPGLWAAHTVGGGDKKYRKVHSSGEVTVVVGDDATVLSSIGGGSFIPCAVTALEHFRGVTYGAARWLVVGDHGAIETSSDAIIWSEVAPVANTDLRGAAFGNGRFVAVGDAGLILSSSDGNDWRPRPSGVTNGLRAVFFGGGNFIAVGERGTLLVSNDGERWRPHDISTHKELTSVCFGNGFWIVAADSGDLWLSANRTSWSQFDTPYKDLTGLAYNNGLFVMIARGVVLSSSDGKHWEQHVHGISAELRDLSFENGRVIAVGNDQTIAISDSLQSP